MGNKPSDHGFKEIFNKHLKYVNVHRSTKYKLVLKPVLPDYGLVNRPNYGLV